MKVAIIGTGNVGKALGRSLGRAGHEVTFASRDTSRTEEAATEVGARVAGTPAIAAADAEVVILAVPYAALDEVAQEIGAGADGKVVVDVTNPLKPDYSGLATDGRSSAAEQLAARLPNAHVAKAFNTLFAGVQADPAADGTTIDALFATDDDEARTAVATISRSIGFRPVDAGPLQAARQLEALAWLNMQIQMRFNGDWRSAFVLVAAPRAATSA